MDPRTRARSIATLASVAMLVSAGETRAEAYGYRYHLSAQASSGADEPGLNFFELVSISGQGVAMVSGGTVSLAPNQIVGALDAVGGFAGSIANAAADFEFGGAVTTFECGALTKDEACISGGGFGGDMALTGVQYDLLYFDIWGIAASQLIKVPVPIPVTVARVQAQPWTTGRASAWFHLPLIDPTPFRMTETGTFRGLPSTYARSDGAGFTLVAPMVVTSSYDVQVRARGIMSLEVRFAPEPAQLPAIASLLVVLGIQRGFARRRAALPTLRCQSPEACRVRAPGSF